MNQIEKELSPKYDQLPWIDARKMRNVIVHDYDSVNFKEVYLTATQDLPVLANDLLDVKNDIKKVDKATFTTARLILRPWDDFDADELFELAKEPEIGYWCGWNPHKHIRDTFFNLHNFLEIEETYAICLKENGLLIGSIGLSFNTDLAEKENECELGYWIGKEYWNNGYATEASKKIIEHAFNDLNIRTIWCGYYNGNERSKRVQEKLGFTYHHTCENVNVPQLKTTRIGHSNILTKEQWEKDNKKSEN